MTATADPLLLFICAAAWATPNPALCVLRFPLQSEGMVAPWLLGGGGAKGLGVPGCHWLVAYGPS
jgi:hypothetical protein